MKQNIVNFFFILIISLFLTSCGVTKMFHKKNSDMVPAVPVTMTVRASSDVNKNLTGDPSPIVVTVYQLKDQLAFNMSNFFTLYQQSKTALSNDLLDSQQIMLRPGQQQSINMALSPDARYIGVVAAYSDIQNSQWRALWPVNQKKLKKILISVNATSVSIGSG